MQICPRCTVLSEFITEDVGDGMRANLSVQLQCDLALVSPRRVSARESFLFVVVAILLGTSVPSSVLCCAQLHCSGFDLISNMMQTALQPLHHRCGIALLPSRRSTCSQTSPRRVRGEKARQALQMVIRCNSSDTDRQEKAGCTSRTLLGAALAAAMSMGAFASTESALAKTNPVKKSDPYEVTQKNTARIELKQCIFRTV